MKLKAYINGIEYENLVVGVSFTEEFNETLDSGVLIIDDVEGKNDIQSYDDVFIYSDDEEFEGFDSRNYEVVKVNTYRDFDNHTVSIGIYDFDVFWSNSFAYTCKIKCIPNNALDKTIYVEKDVTFSYDDMSNEYMMVIDGADYIFTKTSNLYVLDYNSDFVSMYISDFVYEKDKEYATKPSFYKHLLVDQITFERLNPTQNLYKYKLELFSETKGLEIIQLPNISITQPLNSSKKLSIFDYIVQYLKLYNPKVKYAVNEANWVYMDKYTLADEIETIFKDTYCPDFTLDNPSLRDLLNQLFLVKDRIPYVVDNVIYAMDITKRGATFNENKLTSVSSSYSSDNYAHNLKRTYQNALSEENTARRTEYLGFRNSNTALMTIGNMRLETKFPIYKINKVYLCYYKVARVLRNDDNSLVKDISFLCKQDITPLVKLEQERNTLSQDWDDFTNNAPSGDNCVEEMAQYRLCTVGYSIGSNLITGWGTKYQYPKGWWDITKTYFENIISIIDRNKPYGINSLAYLNQAIEPDQHIGFAYNWYDNIAYPSELTGKDALKLKLFFFEVDYECFYNGTVITSKDGGYKDITINDNSSSSLTLLEKDGLFQKEKINRFANEGYILTATYDDISEVQPLGSVYGDDIIIYHKEIQIYSNFVKAVYFGTKDYVLRNYWVSVYAKHRPYALLDYDQSVKRAENRKKHILLSKSKMYYERPIDNNFKYFNFINFEEDLLSFFNNSDEDKVINSALIGNENLVSNIFYADMVSFTSGFSLCFNTTMNDNVSAGQWLKVFMPDMNSGLSNTEDDYTGSVLDFYPIIDDEETGFIEKLGVYFAHTPKETFDDYVVDDYNISMASGLYSKIFELPYVYNDELFSSTSIGDNFLMYKDNKEVIDMTFQIEPYTTDKDIIFSDWMMKLSNLYGRYEKNVKNYAEEYVESWDGTEGIWYEGVEPNDYVQKPYITMPSIVFKISRTTTMADGDALDKILHFDKTTLVQAVGLTRFYTELEIHLKRVEYTDLTVGITVYADIKKTYQNADKTTEIIEENDVELYFPRVNEISANDFSGDTANYYYSNILTNQDYELTDTLSNVWGEGYLSHTGTAKNNVFLISGSEWGLFKFSDTFGYITHNKNLFIKIGTDHIDNSIIYEEYTDLTIRNLMNVSANNVFKFRKYLPELAVENNYVNSISVNMTLLADTTRNVQLWYKIDGKYHFVFGVNLYAEDFENDWLNIYVSQLDKKDIRIYNQHNLVIGEMANFADENDLIEEYGNENIFVVK